MLNFRGSRFVIYRLAGVVLFALTTHYVELPFYQPVWQALPVFDIQRSMAKSLVHSKQLIGKSRADVIDMLKVKLPNQRLVPGPQGMDVMAVPLSSMEWTSLYVYFKNDVVVDAGV